MHHDKVSARACWQDACQQPIADAAHSALVCRMTSQSLHTVCSSSFCRRGERLTSGQRSPAAAPCASCLGGPGLGGGGGRHTRPVCVSAGVMVSALQQPDQQPHAASSRLVAAPTSCQQMQQCGRPAQRQSAAASLRSASPCCPGPYPLQAPCGSRTTAACRRPHHWTQSTAGRQRQGLC